jgi:hypothetical protein
MDPWSEASPAYRYVVQTLADATGADGGQAIVSDLYRCPQCALAQLPEGEPMVMYDRLLALGCKVTRTGRDVTVIPLRARPDGTVIDLPAHQVEINDTHAARYLGGLDPAAAAAAVAEAERLLVDARRAS